MARKPTGNPPGRPRKQAASCAAQLADREGIPLAEAVERVPGAKLSTAYDAAARQARQAPRTVVVGSQVVTQTVASPRPNPEPANGEAVLSPIDRLRSYVAHDAPVAGLVEDLLADEAPEDITTLDRVRRLILRTERRALEAKEQRFGTLGTLLDRLYARERQLLGPPPVRPDAVLEELRRLDGELLRRIEEHAAEPITSAEIH